MNGRGLCVHWGLNTANGSNSAHTSYQMVTTRRIGYVTVNNILNMWPNDTDDYLLQIWDNKLLTWDPDKYSGIQTVRLDASLVWIPDIVLYNRLVLIQKRFLVWQRSLFSPGAGKAQWWERSPPTNKARVQVLCQVEFVVGSRLVPFCSEFVCFPPSTKLPTSPNSNCPPG